MASSCGFIPENGIILDFSDVAPSPSKDFCQILVNCKKKKVIFRNWKVTPRSRENLLHPIEIKNNYEDFLNDDRCHSEIHRVFGPEMLEYVTCLVKGHLDYLPRLPKRPLLNILTFLELEDVSRMSQVSKNFHELCISDDLWEKIYKHNSEAAITEELVRLAEEVGWRKLFFTNKLQLQVQINRQRKRKIEDMDSEDEESASDSVQLRRHSRKQYTPIKAKSVGHSNSDTFLTEELE